MQQHSPMDLHGRIVVITRPAGTAAALARQVRARGGVPLLLPGMSLRGAADVPAARKALRQALADERMIFTSPAAVRHAAALGPLRTRAVVLAVGQGTAQALRRQGVAAVVVPLRQDSEGLLALAELQLVQACHVSLIGASGGRSLLREQLAARGAHVRELHVYRRVPPRLDHRHIDALLRLPASARMLLSSGQALQNLHALLPPAAWQRLCSAVVVVSSERLAAAAATAGFQRIVVADSALAGDLLDGAAQR